MTFLRDSVEVRLASARVFGPGAIRVSCFLKPAKNQSGGGDWCEAFAVNEDIVAVSIGDVSGHGLQAYPVMLEIKQLIRQFAASNWNAAQGLAAANHYLLEAGQGELASALLGYIDLRKRSFSFANAGHPPPLLATDSINFLEYPTADVLLGIETDFLPELRQVHLPAESFLLLYSDGVSEHSCDLLRGQFELVQVMASALRRERPVTAQWMAEQLRLSESNRDDIAIMTIHLPKAG